MKLKRKHFDPVTSTCRESPDATANAYSWSPAPCPLCTVHRWPSELARASRTTNIISLLLPFGFVGIVVIAANFLPSMRKYMFSFGSSSWKFTIFTVAKEREKDVLKIARKKSSRTPQFLSSSFSLSFVHFFLFFHLPTTTMAIVAVSLPDPFGTQTQIVYRINREKHSTCLPIHPFIRAYEVFPLPPPNWLYVGACIWIWHIGKEQSRDAVSY